MASFGRSPVILVVSGDVERRAMIREALGAEFLVAEADSAESAAAAHAKEAPEIVVLDLELPGDGALPFIRALRRTRRDWTPVLAVVGASPKFDLGIRAMRAGATDVLPADRIRSALRGRVERLFGTTLAARRSDRRQQEVNAIYEALPECGGNISRLARETGIPRSTLYGLLRDIGFWEE